MTARSMSRLVRGGEFLAEIDVKLVEADDGWAPYLRPEDAYKLDDVRDALVAGDIECASRIADRVYQLTQLFSPGRRPSETRPPSDAPKRRLPPKSGDQEPESRDQSPADALGHLKRELLP